MASTADFKNGLVLNIDGQLWTITEFQHVKPGKGPAFVRTKLKNVLTGKVVAVGLLESCCPTKPPKEMMIGGDAPPNACAATSKLRLRA